MKKNIFLVRHGESMEDLNNQIYSEITDFQIPLTLEGIEQVKNLAYDLSTKCTAKTVIFHPSCKRVKQTAQILFQKIDSVKEMIEDERLIKINWGSVKLENRKQHEKRRYEVGVLDYRFPDGENGRDVVERTKLFIRELVQIIKLRDFENIIIVSHGFNYRIILMLLLSLSEETFTDLANPPHCFCSQLEYEDGKFLINSELLKYDRSANKSYIEKTGPN